jgi:hypothetical protein
MNKQAVSVTLASENLLWLQAQAKLRRARSLSATLDQILDEARTSARQEIRSVVGTVRIDPADPELHAADEAIRSLFAASLARPGTRQRPVGRASRRRG